MFPNFENALQICLSCKHVSLLVTALQIGLSRSAVVENIFLLVAENASRLDAGHVSLPVAQDLCRSTQEL